MYIYIHYVYIYIYIQHIHMTYTYKCKHICVHTYEYLAREKPPAMGFVQVPTAPTRVEPTVPGHPWEGSRGSGNHMAREHHPIIFL